MIEKERISTNSSRFPKVTGPFEVEYKLKFKMLMAVIKIPTLYQTLEVQNKVSECKLRELLFTSFCFLDNNFSDPTI